jgi:hypothetical protein
MEIKKKRLEEEMENGKFKFFKKLDERDELEKDMKNGKFKFFKKLDEQDKNSKKS